MEITIFKYLLTLLQIAQKCIISISLFLIVLSCSHPHSTDSPSVLYYNGSKIEKSKGNQKNVVVLKSFIKSVDIYKTEDSITIDYPFTNSLFPPDMVAPQFLWHDKAKPAQLWLICIQFDSSKTKIYTFTNGKNRFIPNIDSECVRENNKWEESNYQKTARAWTPDSSLWETIKQNSRERKAHIDIYGFNETKPVSFANIVLTISQDPVGAPIFYRDVPLMPARNPNGVIQPISQDAVPLIAWRLRDISKQSAPVVMKRMPTCINCHSFSSNGKTLGMDMDGPNGDKGAYALVPTAKRIVVQQSDVFSWNKFNKEKNTFGLFSRVSPDGHYIASAVDEEVHVVNYLDYHFLQTFYPTRSKIAIYDKQTRKITALPGANDSLFVQCNPVWSPDGKWIAFLRAKARPAFGSGQKAAFANDGHETQIQYNLYRIPFNNGLGGKAEPIQGAVNTGKSVSFPKYSPNGKWIVFVQAQNGLLMRPDSRLYIVPAQGGVARELQCNLPIMNSWHSFSPNGKWMVFSSKSNTPFTQMFLTHLDENGDASPAILIPNSTALNRAVNIPEFVNIPQKDIVSIVTPAVDYKIHFDRGKKLLDSGNVDSAYTSIMKAIELKPDFAENYSTLAFVLAKKGNLDEALKASLKAVENDPANDWMHATAGMLLYGDHKIPESLKQFELAIKLNAHNAVTYYYYGRALEEAGSKKEALANYTKAINIDTLFSDAYNNRGTLMHGNNNVQGAISDFTHAIKAEPKPVFYQNRAIALAQLNNFEKAFSDCDYAIKLDPHAGMTYYVRGNIYMQQKNVQLALFDFTKALDCKEPCEKAIEPICDIFFSMDKHAEAIPYLDREIAKDKQNALLVNRRATAHMYAGNMEKALQDLDFVLSQASAEPSAYFNKALCFEKLGDMNSAIQNYGLAMKYGNPSTKEFAFAKNRIGELQH